MSDLRSLIEAAKADAPNAAARAKVWAGVSTAVGEGAALASSGAVAGSASATKMLVLGTLLGGSLTVGIGAAVLLMRGAAPSPGAGATIAAPAPGEVASPFVRTAPLLSSASTASSLRVRPMALEVSAANDEADVDAVRDPIAAASPTHAVRVPETGAGRRAGAGRSLAALVAVAQASAAQALPASAEAPAAQDDALAREASLLAEARNALAKRDALSALQIIRGLRSMPTRQLIPEELAVEAQALRSLGLEDDANAVDATLRARFPDSVLGR
jgi:hypothetical protein